MLYNQPYGGVADASYVNGNPSTGVAGSIPPAASIEHPQREIVKMITDAGLTPSAGDLEQLAKAIQNGVVNYALDVGTVNAMQITLMPTPTYALGLCIHVKISVTNTGAATINVNALGSKAIIRRGGDTLLANDLLAGSMVMLLYNGTAFELYGANPTGGGQTAILTANTVLWVNNAIGNDANDGISNTAAHALATVQKAVNIAFSYLPSQYNITVNVMNGTYTTGARTPAYAGPTLIITGQSSTSTIMDVGAATAPSNGYNFLCQGPNTMTVTGFKVLNANGTAGPAAFTASANSTMNVSGCTSGACGNGVFQVQGPGFMQVGTHTFSGNANALFYTNIEGYMYLTQSAVFTISTPITVTQAVVWCSGYVVAPTPAPSFVNSGNVTGKRYDVALNGIVNAATLGTSFFPGTVAGTTATGGQYVA